jgi:S-adenosylmethionine-diacylglycerol 3-amino-3-carboxypropyl transferase
MKNYFETINYSSINEDSNSEIKVLQLSKNDEVLCITGSGSRVLNLLTQKPKMIFAVDFNRCQNYLLELKIEAIRHLDYEDYISFLGLIPSSNRLQYIDIIEYSLSEGARKFWKKNSNLIIKGIIYQGRWEKYFRNLARIIKLIRPNLLNKLFDCTSIEEQNFLWNESWDDSTWRFFIRAISYRVDWKYFFGDPGFYKYVPKYFSIENYLNSKFSSAIENFLFSQSPFVNILFKGKFNLDAPLPVYLQKDYHLILRENLNSIHIKTGSISDVFDASKGTNFSAFSLSDFSSYVNDSDYENIWKLLLERSKDGARVCERQFLVKREIPIIKKNLIMRDHLLERELEKTDSSIFYSFIVANINK